MELIIASVVAFASTNIDDIFILILFFSNKDYKSKEVVIGQYLGIITLLVISLIGSLIGLLIAKHYVGLLGLLPIFFGVRNVLQLGNHNKTQDKEGINTNKNAPNNILSVAGVTVANGGDNIGIYIPLFATLMIEQKIVMVGIFLMMVAIWCFVARYLSKHRAVAQSLDKYGHIITPLVLIALGIYILYESGSFNLLSGN